jgi:hypothetical protein
MLGPMTLTQQMAADILAALIGVGGEFVAPFAGVGSAIDDQGKDTTLADITPVAGAAGTRLAVAWGGTYFLADGSSVVDSDPLVFAPVGAEEDNVRVLFLADLLAAGNLMGYMVESEPVPIRLGRPYSAIVRLVVSPTGKWSVSFSWNGAA